MTVLEGPKAIGFYQLAARKAALKLENLGMKHSSGKSMYALVKREYGLKGTRQEVADQLQKMVEEAIASRIEGR